MVSLCFEQRKKVLNLKAEKKEGFELESRKKVLNLERTEEKEGTRRKKETKNEA
jgi:hypothetical protein